MGAHQFLVGSAPTSSADFVQRKYSHPQGNLIASTPWLVLSPSGGVYVAIVSLLPLECRSVVSVDESRSRSRRSRPDLGFVLRVSSSFFFGALFTSC